MMRQIIHIDEDKCDGCGLCATACHEGAIDIVDGKAKLVREHFCDGFGDCLPNCPTGAITFETREAPEYDKAAVEAAMNARKNQYEREETTMTLEEIMQIGDETERRAAMMKAVAAGEIEPPHHAGGCPGSRSMQLKRE